MKKFFFFLFLFVCCTFPTLAWHGAFTIDGAGFSTFNVRTGERLDSYDDGKISIFYFSCMRDDGVTPMYSCFFDFLVKSNDHYTARAALYPDTRSVTIDYLADPGVEELGLKVRDVYVMECYPIAVQAYLVCNKKDNTPYGIRIQGFQLGNLHVSGTIVYDPNLWQKLTSFFKEYKAIIEQ